MDFMNLIREVTKDMCEEAMSAKDYLDRYLEQKIECPMMAELYLELVPIELEHYRLLKKGFEKVVDANATDIPIELVPIWEFEMSRLEPLAVDIEMRYTMMKRK